MNTDDLEVTEFATLAGFLEACDELGHVVSPREGNGEDPYTHYYAYANLSTVRHPAIIGYFGDSNGTDNDHGALGKTPGAFDRWFGQVV